MSPRDEVFDTAEREAWFTFEEGVKKGPWDRIIIRRKLRDHELSGNSLVWNEHLPGWRPIRAVKSLWPVEFVEDDVAATRIEPSVVANATSVSTLPQEGQSSDSVILARPRPWQRWMAKIIDAWISGFLAGILFVAFGAGDSEWINNNFLGSIVAVSILCLLVEPAFHAAGRRTPGKGLLRISITKNGAQLSWQDAFKRSTSAWLKGMGLGIPLVSLVTFTHQYSELKTKGATTYDRALGLTVTHGELSTGRKVAVGVVLAGLLVLFIAGRSGS